MKRLHIHYLFHLLCRKVYTCKKNLWRHNRPKDKNVPAWNYVYILYNYWSKVLLMMENWIIRINLITAEFIIVIEFGIIIMIPIFVSRYLLCLWDLYIWRQTTITSKRISWTSTELSFFLSSVSLTTTCSQFLM